MRRKRKTEPQRSAKFDAIMESTVNGCFNAIPPGVTAPSGESETNLPSPLLEVLDARAIVRRNLPPPLTVVNRPGIVRRTVDIKNEVDSIRLEAEVAALKDEIRRLELALADCHVSVRSGHSKADTANDEADVARYELAEQRSLTMAALTEWARLLSDHLRLQRRVTKLDRLLDSAHFRNPETGRLLPKGQRP